MSRLRSSRGSSAAAAASAPATRRPGVLVQSPKSDIYVVMLGVALGAIVISCLLMLRIFGINGFSTKAAAASGTAQVGSMV